MVYINFHIGDWISSTRLLTATERGVYFDLLTQYYVDEGPLMRSQCDRISRAYADEEREAMRYVLNEFFEDREDGYHCARCDRDIAACREKSKNAQKSAQARWLKKTPVKTSETMRPACESDASAVQSQCERMSERNANALQPNTHNPIPITQICVSNETHTQASPAPRKRAKSVASILKPEGVPDQEWFDYLAVRKAKRLPLTETAWKDFLDEVEKAGITVADAVHICCVKGWGGFKASWLKNEQARTAGLPPKVNRPLQKEDMEYEEVPL